MKSVPKAASANLSYSDIRIGSVYSFERQISEGDAATFAQLTGDFNPIHTDSSYAQENKFKGKLVHGMLAAGFFSTLIGMHCPGEKSLYLSQTLQFKKPLFCGDLVTVKGTVTGKNDSIQVLSLETQILKGNSVAVTGEAKVKVLS